MKGIDYSQLLKKYDLKATPQRVIFLKELEDAGHLSIEELEKRIKKTIPTISTATVYKNINAMVEKGLLSEVKIPNGKNRYEITKGPHAHFVCENCGEIIDLHIDTKCLEKEIKNHLISHISVAIKGICSNCAKSEKIS